MLLSSGFTGPCMQIDVDTKQQILPKVTKIDHCFSLTLSIVSLHELKYKNNDTFTGSPKGKYQSPLLIVQKIFYCLARSEITKGCIIQSYYKTLLTRPKNWIVQ